MTGDVHLRLIADDLTGALDSAAAFGPGVPVYLDQPPPALDRAEVSVVATATRDIPPHSLPSALAACVPWLRDAGLSFKKVDSLLRGNTLEEVRWLATECGFTRVIMAPALPAQGRYMLHDHLAVAPAGVQPGGQHLQGDNVRTALHSSAWPAECELVLPEVFGDADLDALCAQYLRAGGRALWCGSSGLAAALARKLFIANAPAEQAMPATGNKLWVIGASHQAVTQRQWGRAMAAYPHALAVRGGDARELHAVAQALSGVGSAAGVSDLALINLSPSTPLSAAEASALLQSQVAQLTHGTVVPARLLVIGGDTVRALAGATGVQHMVSGIPVRSGWGRAQWCGGRWGGVWMDCRSGAFGGDDDLSAAIAAVVS
jgi:uncharacterized protein YgbK (DUF1537 family)